MKKSTSGFTIVELLIVIVVIAILAAISVVAYRGVSNRANDSAVQADLKSFWTKVELLRAENGVYPRGGTGYSGGDSSFPPQNMTPIKVSTRSYDASVNNLYYCEGVAASSGQASVSARSTSGKAYAISTGGSLREYTGTWDVSSNICPGTGVAHYSHSTGFGLGTSTWAAWTQ